MLMADGDRNQRYLLRVDAVEDIVSVVAGGFEQTDGVRWPGRRGTRDQD